MGRDLAKWAGRRPSGRDERARLALAVTTARRETRSSHGRRRPRSGRPLAEATAASSVSAGPGGRAGRGPEGVAVRTQPPWM